ncbi:hypothetical protein HDU97_000420 [Phlyctochytrium planicorne]|nr:hypothetical protein HDU97_000420 [Phlyctochytrium planicorne]
MKALRQLAALQVAMLGNACLIAMLCGVLMRFAIFLSAMLGGVQPSGREIHGAVSLYQMCYSFHVKGISGVSTHLLRVSSLVVLTMGVPMLLATIYANEASRLIMILAFYLATFLTHHLFNDVICERKDSFLVYSYNRSQWGEEWSRRRLFFWNLQQSFSVFMVILSTLFIQFAWNVGVRIAGGVMEGVPKKEVARALKFDFQHIGTVFARIFIFRDADSETIIGDEFFWAFALFQIISERLIPRTSIIANFFKRRFPKQKSSRTAKVDVDVVDIEAVKDGAQNIKEDTVKQPDSDVAKNEVETPGTEYLHHAEERNDFTFSCYKSTLIAATVTLYMKSPSVALDILLRTILWKFAVYLGLEILLESIYMSLELQKGIPLHEFASLDLCSVLKQFTFAAFYSMFFYNGPKELFAYG